jgi:hypothetical protein
MSNNWPSRAMYWKSWRKEQIWKTLVHCPVTFPVKIVWEDLGQYSPMDCISFTTYCAIRLFVIYNTTDLISSTKHSPATNIFQIRGSHCDYYAVCHVGYTIVDGYLRHPRGQQSYLLGFCPEAPGIDSLSLVTFYCFTCYLDNLCFVVILRCFEIKCFMLRRISMYIYAHVCVCARMYVYSPLFTWGVRM